MSQSVLDKLHMILYSSFCAAIDNDYCSKNPVSFIRYKSNRQKNPKHVYNADEIEIVKRYGATHLPEITFILETGLRRGEICGLRWETDINFDKKSVSVNRSIADQYGGGVKEMPPKWNSYRELPLSPDALELLLKLKSLNDSGYVFPNNKGLIQGPTALSRKIKRHMQIIEKMFCCKALTAHELRHTFGTNLRRSGIDIYTIQRMMGHKDINITSEIYVHNEFDELKKVMGY